MPRRTAETFPGLKIELEKPWHTFVPGEKLSGVVTYKPEKRINFDAINITFRGRSKTLWADGTGHGLDDHRGERIFFSISQNIHSQDVPPMEPEYAWPFEFDIPMQPSVGTNFKTFGDEFKPQQGFLSTEEMSGHLLPSTFFGTGNQGFHTVEGYIEYFLTAGMHERDKYDKHHETILPIKIRQHADTAPMARIELGSRKQQFQFKSTNFLPVDQQPSGKTDKMKYFFKSSKVPSYTFQIVVDAPRVIQLSHPAPISFRLCRLHTGSTKKETTLDPSHPFPDVVVKSVSIQLRATTVTRFQAILMMEERDFSNKIDLVKINLNGSDETKPLSIPIVEEKDYMSKCKDDSGERPRLDITQYPSAFPTRALLARGFPTRSFSSQEPVAKDGEAIVPPPSYNHANAQNGPIDYSIPETSEVAGSRPPALTDDFVDLGAALDLHLTRRNAIVNRKPQRRFREECHETFQSYNVGLKYDLLWSIEIECGGETQKIEYERWPVTVLSETEDAWTRRDEKYKAEGVNVGATKQWEMPVLMDALNSRPLSG